MKPQNRFQLDGLVNGFVQLTIIDDGFKRLVRVTPRKMLGIVSQLKKIDDKTARTVLIPVKETLSPIKISHTEARQLVAEIDGLMKWQR